MRNKFWTVLGASVLALTSAAALAADLPSRRAPPAYAPPPPIPVFTWTGIFVGLNAGAAFGQDRGPVGTGSGASFVGGGQIGFNYEFGSSTAGLGVLSGVGNAFNTVGGGLGHSPFGANSGIVFGVVADADYLDGHNGANFAGGPGNPNGIFYSSTDYLGTVRGRLGVAFDRVFLYGTGGYAYNLRNDGYAVGGGLEFAVTHNVSVGAEYLRVDFRRGGVTADTGGALFNERGDFNVARAFVNYKFDLFQPLAPVVARY